MTPPDAAHALSLPGTAFDGPGFRRIQHWRFTAGSAPVLCERAAGQIASVFGIDSGSNQFGADRKLDGKDEGLLLSLLVSCLSVRRAAGGGLGLQWQLPDARA